ncbi:uncharacterized protein [Eurosta solidaginis]|uniref:uncharacterized protein n=1 Tax=Eurosta solidaginis TaxID=178769 RepID=UPI003530618B
MSSMEDIKASAMSAQTCINKMVIRKLSTTLLICIIYRVLSSALEPVAVKVSSTHETMKSPAITEDAYIGLKKTSGHRRHTNTQNSTKELDGRSAYINNQYIDDENSPPTPYNDTSIPLYQFLQEQMEQILATSLPGEYRLQDNQPNIATSAHDDDDDDLQKSTLINEGYGVPVLQSTDMNPVHFYGGVSSAMDDDLIPDPYEKKKQNEENSLQSTMPTKPVLELPKPISFANDVSLRPESSQIKTKSHTHSSMESKLATNHVQLQNYKSPLKQNHSSSTGKLSYGNSTLHMRKRRITFKTISTSSQIISTPMADLLFKYSIGIARPSLGAAANPLHVQTSELERNVNTKVCNDKLNPLRYNKPISLGYVDRTELK